MKAHHATINNASIGLGMGVILQNIGLNWARKMKKPTRFQRGMAAKAPMNRTQDRVYEWNLGQRRSVSGPG